MTYRAGLLLCGWTLSCVLPGLACRSTENPPAAVDRSQLLAAAGSCATSTYADFRDRALELEAATSALATTPTVESRTAGREAFGRAMDSWQVAELMQFGPAARTPARGGQSLRDRIYAWPQFGRCNMEGDITTRAYEASDFMSVASADRRGMAALEYLLFYEGIDSACTATSPHLPAWTALTPAEKDQGRLAFAAVAGKDVSTAAATLHTAWDPASGNFEATLRTAGPGNAVYPTGQAALNAVTDAIFYIEGITKDLKLHGPLGLDVVVCTADVCPGLLESPFGGRSKANIAANLDGLRRLLEGCAAGYSGYGFDDLLTEMGATALAETLAVRSAAAQAALAAIEEPDLQQALLADKPSVRALYDALKGVTDLLKADFKTVLDIGLPADIGSDND